MPTAYERAKKVLHILANVNDKSTSVMLWVRFLIELKSRLKCLHKAHQKLAMLKWVIKNSMWDHDMFYPQLQLAHRLLIESIYCQRLVHKIGNESLRNEILDGLAAVYANLSQPINPAGMSIDSIVNRLWSYSCRLQKHYQATIHAADPGAAGINIIQN